MTWQIITADVLEGLASLPDESVQTVVTSPPYWGLRDYGTADWEGGDAACDHVAGPLVSAMSTLDGGKQPDVAMPFLGDCGKCGARRIDKQLGLEPTPEAYVARIVEVFRAVRRVLRSDGTCWVNLGDSYASSVGHSDHSGFAERHRERHPDRSYRDGKVASADAVPDFKHRRTMNGLKPKDLVGIPWRVAFALQADGWVLRSEVIWGKPNPMPESVTDRPTKAHEQVFLLSKARWTGPERGRFAHISDEDARWLALFFDTEGNIVVKRSEREDGRRQYGAQIAFANTSRALVERAQAIVGAGSIHERAGTNAPMFYWQMANQQARDLLYRIYPFLIVKQRQAAVGIHMQDVIAEPKKRPKGHRSEDHAAFLERCWETVKLLNRFGLPDLSWVPEPRYGRWVPEPYFYDADAVREPHTAGNLQQQLTQPSDRGDARTFKFAVTERYLNPAGRNLRSVWLIPTEPFPEAHFATFPKALVVPCVKAGTSEKGCCPECGAAWVRQTEDTPDYAAWKASLNGGTTLRIGEHREGGNPRTLPPKSVTTGWTPSCSHSSDPIPCLVLDPFAGSGTVGVVALRHGRSFVGIELNPEYAEMARTRIRNDGPLFNVPAEVDPPPSEPRPPSVVNKAHTTPRNDGDRWNQAKGGGFL